MGFPPPVPVVLQASCERLQSPALVPESPAIGCLCRCASGSDENAKFSEAAQRSAVALICLNHRYQRSSVNFQNLATIEPSCRSFTSIEISFPERNSHRSGQRPSLPYAPPVDGMIQSGRNSNKPRSTRDLHHHFPEDKTGVYSAVEAKSTKCSPSHRVFAFRGSIYTAKFESLAARANASRMSPSLRWRDSRGKARTMRPGCRVRRPFQMEEAREDLTSSLMRTSCEVERRDLTRT